MKNFIIHLYATCFLLMGFSFQGLHAQNYTLEFNLEKGKTYKQRLVSDNFMAMEVMGQDIEIKMNMEMLIHYNVIGQNNNVFDITTTYQKIKTNMSAPAEFIIDSDSPDASTDKTVGNVFKSMIGMPIEMQMTKDGKVLSTKGIDKIIETTNALTEEQKQMIGQQFSEKAIQTSFEQLSSFFPGKPVSINESWDSNKSLNAGGIDIISKTKYTLKQVKDNVATLAFTGTLVSPEGGSVIQIQGMEAQVSMKGEQSGTMLIDMKTGWIIRSEQSQKSVQNIDVMGFELQQTMEGKTVITAE